MNQPRDPSGTSSGPYGLEDEGFHEPGDRELYNESLYFNFYDPDVDLGGVIRLGFRPNLGYCESSLYLFDPPDQILFDYRRGSCDQLGTFSCHGLSMRCEDPFQSWTLTYDGAVVTLSDPTRMATEPGAVLKQDPREDLTLNLNFRARYPHHTSTPGGDMSSGVSQFARDHYEQFGFITGSVERGDGVLSLQRAPSFRDHSWGVRDWLSWDRFDQVMFSCGDGTCVSAGLVVNHEGKRAPNGVVWTESGPREVTAVHLDSRYEGELRNESEFALRVETGNSSQWVGTGKPILDLPLTNRPEGDNPPEPGGFNRLSSVLTEFEFADSRGWGITDMMRFMPEAD